MEIGTSLAPLCTAMVYVDHSRGNGSAFYRLARQLDLEDNARSPHWIKIKNPMYSQTEGRGD
jgi:hypothetical protein